MPRDAITLALAASIYPPAVAAIIALGRGTEVRLRVVLLVVSAYLTAFVTGSLMLLAFNVLGATGDLVWTPTAAVYLAGGVALLLLAVHLHRRRREPARSVGGPSRTERYLQSRWLVMALGFTLYVVPSPIYVAAVKAIADVEASSAQELAYLAEMLLIMLWMIELPMLALVAFPQRATALLQSINAWFLRHGHALAVLVAAAVGAYLVALGLVELST